MRIGELAKRTQIPAHTIRFYESKGLLGAAQRSGNGYRVYDDDSVESLFRIRLAQRLGFTLDEIMAFRTPDEKPGHNVLMQQLDVRLEEIRAMQQKLTQQEAEIKAIQTIFKQHDKDAPCLSTEEMEALIKANINKA